jgi:hypothetical protein
MSPSFPRRGSATADNSIGPAITHATVVSPAPNSRAMTPSETTRIVIGNVDANNPARAASRTQVG